MPDAARDQSADLVSIAVTTDSPAPTDTEQPSSSDIGKAVAEMEAFLGISPGLPHDPAETVSWFGQTREIPASIRLATSVPGYEILGELGRGGMGVVYKARQLQLSRAVALKMILSGDHAGSNALARFRTEAEAVARLKHPGIVQIHESGTHNGLPYFSLEFVEGGSLDRKLQGTPLPANSAARLTVLLAQAMHAAHENGILHRDLKPANIFLQPAKESEGISIEDRSGKSGHYLPKIGDFGLAKKLHDADDTDSPASAGLTATGAVMGTPSYMAPEQAGGKSKEMTPLVDVYALGAILYELLTGRPPFRAATLLDTLRQVMADEPVPPRKFNDKIPRDLETICLKCLRKEPQKRYGSARVLAEDLERFLAGKAILARPVGSVERVVKWCRRRPAVAAMIAVSTLAVVGVLILGGFYLSYRAEQRGAANARRQQIDDEARVVLNHSQTLLEEGWDQQDLARLIEARAEADRATDIARSGSGSDAILKKTETIQSEARRKLERAETNRKLLAALLDISAPKETVRTQIDESGRTMAKALTLPSLDKQFATAFQRWGVDVNASDVSAVVARFQEEPAVIAQEVIGGLDAWMLARRSQNRPEAEWRRLFQIADRLDASERGRQLRRMMVGNAPVRVESVTSLIGPQPAWPALWELGRGRGLRTSLDLLSKLDPSTEPVLAVEQTARMCTAQRNLAGAEKLLRQALARRPNEVVLLNSLGENLEQQQRGSEAIECYRSARALRPELGVTLGNALGAAGRWDEAEAILLDLIRQQPANAETHSNLGHAFFQQKKWNKAETELHKAIEFDPNSGEAYCNLGATLAEQHKLDAAVAAYRKAIDLNPKFADAYFNLGNALDKQKKLDHAVAAYRKAIDLDPTNADAYNNLANCLRRQKKFDEAIAACRKAIDLKPDNAEAYFNLGNVLDDQQKRDEAVEAFHKAIDLKPDFAEAFYNLGNARRAQQKFEEAVAAYRKAIDIKPNDSDAHFNLGVALYEQKKTDEAVAAYRKAIDLKPNDPNAYDNLGRALHDLRRLDEAVAAYRKAIELKPDLAQAYYNLSISLRHQRKFDAAVAACRKAIDLEPDDADSYNGLGSLLDDQQKRDEAVVAFRKAIELDPDSVEPQLNLGVVKMAQAQYKDAIAALKKAKALVPEEDRRRQKVQNLLQKCERRLALEPRLPAVIDGTDKPANVSEQMEFASICSAKKLYAAATGLRRSAFIADPRIAENVEDDARYDAACDALLAASGQGKDTDKWNDKERGQWRRQALDWLRADLTWWNKALDAKTQSGAVVQKEMRHWQTDTDLSSIRDKDAIAKLPEAERAKWQQFWTDVAALLQRAEDKN